MTHLPLRNISLLTGAGASAPLGMPTMTGFIRRLGLRDRISQAGLIEAVEHTLRDYELQFEPSSLRIIAASLLALPADSRDIQSLLRLLDGAISHLSSLAVIKESRTQDILSVAFGYVLPHIDPDAVPLLNRCRHLLEELIFACYRRSEDISLKDVEEVYAPIVETLLANGHLVAFATTNYDTAAESFLFGSRSMRGHRIYDGFPRSRSRS
jgi:hypothetical protein